MEAAISPTHMATAAQECHYLNEHIQYMQMAMQIFRYHGGCYSNYKNSNK